MPIKNLFIFLITVSVVFSCDNINSKKDLNSDHNEKPTSNIKTNHTIVDLTPKAQKMIQNWKEYQNINEYIQQYEQISINNSLLNARHLSELAQQLKDSISIEKLNVPSVKIRLNVLYNETLRLADMATINQITETEVIRENNNIINAYSALNIKLNNIISQEHLNNEVNTFINEVVQNKTSYDTVVKITDSIQQ
jgi:hypothetical protein